MLQVMNSLKKSFPGVFTLFVVGSADTTQERRGASAYALVDVVHAAQDVEIVLQLHLHLEPQPQPQLQLQLQLQLHQSANAEWPQTRFTRITEL